MELNAATSALAALGQPSRLSIFRLLVQAGPAGMIVGAIGDRLAIPGATLSFHLKELAAAGLVVKEQQGRCLCYRANFEAMNSLLGFLTENCCAGVPCDVGNTSCMPIPST